MCVWVKTLLVDTTNDDVMMHRHMRPRLHVCWTFVNRRCPRKTVLDISFR